MEIAALEIIPAFDTESINIYISESDSVLHICIYKRAVI